jgi:inosine-uridine nucleoside N-ribohydrolase
MALRYSNFDSLAAAPASSSHPAADGVILDTTKGSAMSRISRRQMMRSALLGAAAMGARGLARAQQSVPEVTRAGEPGSTILPPNGVAVSKPRLTDVRRVIVDTDPGNDDALALLMALSAPSLSVEAVTVCPGNMGIEGYDQQVRNALYMVDLAGASGRVPVYRGLARPILGRAYPVASFIHGEYGLGEVEVTTVNQRVEPEHAVDAMRRIVNSAPGEVTILALGGLTNVAMAILRDEAFVRNLRGVIFVGGKYEGPGFSPGYNVLVDPEAAEVVVRSGVPLLMTGDASRRDSVLVAEDYDHAAELNTRRSDFFIKSNALRRTYEMSYRGAAGSINADPMAVALAADATLGQKYMSVAMKVELEGDYSRGLLVYGEDIYSGNPVPPGNVDICIAADHERFRQMVFQTLQMG